MFCPKLIFTCKLAKSTMFTIMPMHGTTKVSNPKKYTQIVIMHYTQKGKQTFSEKHLFFLTSHEKEATERPPPRVYSSYAPVPIAVSLKNGHAPPWSVGHLQVFPWLVQPVRDLPQLLHGALKAAQCNTASYSLQLTGFPYFSPPVGIGI